MCQACVLPCAQAGLMECLIDRDYREARGTWNRNIFFQGLLMGLWRAFDVETHMNFTVSHHDYRSRAEITSLYSSSQTTVVQTLFEQTVSIQTPPLNKGHLMSLQLNKIEVTWLPCQHPEDIVIEGCSIAQEISFVSIRSKMFLLRLLRRNLFK